MSASSYYNDQHPAGGLQAGYQQGYSEQEQQSYQISEQPHDTGCRQGYGSVEGYEQGLLYPPGREHDYRPKTGSAQEYYCTDSNEPWISYEGDKHMPRDVRQQQSPPAAGTPQIEQVQKVLPDEYDATPADGERGLAGGLLGSVAGVVAGHQVHHSLLGAIGGGIAGSLLENHFKKQEHEHSKREDEYEHRRRHHHHHHHHHHQQQHSRHRSHSRNGSSGPSFGDDAFSERSEYYGH